MELRVLRYFLAVAREESFSAAAERLHLTQPTLSRQIMELEREMGGQLMIRGDKSRGIRLTEQGMQLRRRAEQLIELADKTQQEMADWRQTATGELSFGGGETPVMGLIARTVARMKEEYPNIRYHLYSGSEQDTAERLDKGLLDFGLLVGAANVAKYDYLRLPARDTWGLLMRRDHPLAQKPSVSRRELEGLTLLVSRQALENNELSGWYGGDFSRLPIAATYNLIYNAALLVEQGLGCALTLDGLLSAKASDALCFRPLEPRLEADVNLVWKKSQAFSQAARIFLARFQQDIGDLES